MGVEGLRPPPEQTPKSARIEERALAKVNLTLAVRGRRPDGYHELSSLVAFARDVFDRVVLRAGSELTVSTDGPFGKVIEPVDLVERAGIAVADRFGDLALGHFTLEKMLPVAAGLGGGSADAAAALRAIARLNGLDDVEGRFGALCRPLGADVPVCLGNLTDGPTAAVMTGVGERVRRPAPGTSLLPQNVYGVLVNPGIEVSTGAVFRQLSAPILADGPAAPTIPMSFRSFTDLVEFTNAARNDLEAPAVAIAPVIGHVLEQLRALPGCRLARMSGSGATCFGLLDTRGGADSAARAISACQPDWWVAATRLV